MEEGGGRPWIMVLNGSHAALIIWNVHEELDFFDGRLALSWKPESLVIGQN